MMKGVLWLSWFVIAFLSLALLIMAAWHIKLRKIIEELKQNTPRQ